MKKISIIVVLILSVFLAGCAGKKPQKQTKVSEKNSAEINNSVQESNNSKVIKATGDNPLWGFVYSDGSLNWSAPSAIEKGKIELAYYETSSIKEGDIFTLKGKSENFGTIEVKVTKTNCHISSKDKKFEYKVELVRQGKTYQGCADVTDSIL